MTDCVGCRWNREDVAVSQLMRELGLPLIDTFSQTLEELRGLLRGMSEKEAKREWDTANSLLSEGDVTGLGSAVWEDKPFALGYCGRDSSVAGMRRAINYFDDCPTFMAGKAANRNCASCAHLSVPPPPELPSSRAVSDAAVRIHRQIMSAIESIAREELMEAVKRQGEFVGDTKHLPVCKALSRGPVKVVGPLVNSRHDCTLWKAKAVEAT